MIWLSNFFLWYLCDVHKLTKTSQNFPKDPSLHQGVTYSFGGFNVATLGAVIRLF